MEELAREIYTDDPLPDPEREKLIALLEADGWNQRQTAREMGIGETTIRRLIERLKIFRPVDS